MSHRLGLKRWRLVAAGFLVILVGCWGGLIARDVLAIRSDARQLQATLVAANGGKIELGSAHACIKSMQAHLISLRRVGAPLLALAPHLGWLPGVGGDVQAVPDLIDAATDLLGAGQIMLDVGESVWPPHSANGQPALAVTAQRLDSLLPQLAQARKALDRGAGRLGRVEVRRLSPGVGQQVARLSAALPLLQSGLALLERVPIVLGFDRPKTYLILMQNNDELRPTGGFISAVARVTLARGEITELDVRDSYQVDDYAHKPYDEPPEPLLEFMGSELWLFRDANWSPDFPTSARKAAELYTYGLNKPVDGVIGLNQYAVREIVGGLGPIQVEPGRPPVDGSTVIDYMRSSWAPPPDAVDFEAWVASRKGFIGKLMNAILAQVQTFPDKVNWVGLGRAMYNTLQSRDTLIWMDDPPTAAILAERNWDGAIRQTASDYVMLVDANLGFNKANVVVQSSIAYTVTVQPDGTAEANMAIRYQHTGPPAEGCPLTPVYDLTLTYEQLIQRCYWDYVRLLVPAGAELEQATPHPVPANFLVVDRPFDGQMRTETDVGKTVFGTLFVLERGHSIDVALSYRLPSVAVWTSRGGQYDLTIQKQSGAAPHHITVTVLWPAGYSFTHASMLPAHVETGSASFSFDLLTDQVLSLTWNR